MKKQFSFAVNEKKSSINSNSNSSQSVASK